MSAHWRPFLTTCDERGCASRVQAEVFDTYNAVIGIFCRKHAKRRVKELQAGQQRRISERLTETGR